MHLKRNSQKHKKALIAGSAALLAVILILVAILVSSCSKEGKFEALYAEGSAAYAAGDFKTAAEKLEDALEYGESVDCYVLLANTYYAGLGDLNRAIDILYTGSYKFDNDTIDSYLESLKAIKAGDPKLPDVITIGTETISPEVTSLVLNQLRLKTEDIAPLAQLKNLESLSLTDNGIAEIGILSGLTKLSFLQLGNNQIVDLSPLESLTELKTLYLDGNPIADFSPLQKLQKLTTLSLKNTGISEEQLIALETALPECSIYCERAEQNDIVEISLGGVTFMSDVTELDLSGKGITDISELSKCAKLQKLDLRDNKISDLTPLMDLTELSWLCIWNNEVQDILPLMGMQSLKYLDADKNAITDITAVSELGAMEELWLSYNAFENIKPLEKLPNLKRLGLKGLNLDDEDMNTLAKLITLTELNLEDNTAISGEVMDELKEALDKCNITHSDLSYTIVLGGTIPVRSDLDTVELSGMEITNLNGMEKFKKLHTLSLSDTAVSDISPLATLSLQVLELKSSGSGQLTSLEPIRGITSLVRVNLTNNSISDISPLGGSTGMSELILTGNNVSDLTVISGMTSLKSLKLDYCPVSDISALSGLGSLQVLSMQNCRISSVSALAGLGSLRELYLDGNSISDLSPLAGLKNLGYLYISGNNVTADNVRALQEALPNCNIYTDLDLSLPEAEMPETEAPQN